MSLSLLSQTRSRLTLDGRRCFDGKRCFPLSSEWGRKPFRTRSSTGQSIGLRNRGLGVRLPPGAFRQKNRKLVEKADPPDAPGSSSAFPQETAVSRLGKQQGLPSRNSCTPATMCMGGEPEMPNRNLPRTILLQSDGFLPFAGHSLQAILRMAGPRLVYACAVRKWE